MKPRWMLLALLLAAGCARLPWSWPLAPAAELDPAPIAADVAWLADDARQGRGLGTAGLAAAAEYLAAGFEAAGLEPGAPEGRYLQTFEMPVAVRIAEARLDAPGVGLRRGRDFEAFLRSADGDLEAELVFAGYGIRDSENDWDDYADLAVAGKVVLILDDRPAVLDAEAGHGDAAHSQLETRIKLLGAQREGAAAVLLAPSDAAATQPAGGVSDPNPNPTASAGKLVALGIDRDAAERLMAASGYDLGDLQQEMDSSGAPASRATGRSVRVVVDVERELGQVSNVVAIRRGSERPDEAVVIGAHYDHLGAGHVDSLTPQRRGEIHNGADDNASGSAALLALARSFSAGPAPRRSLVFVAFTAEEVGLVGSAHYTRQPTVPMAQTVAMLNLDMVGRLRDDRVTVFGVESSPIWPRLLRRAASPLALDLNLVRDAVGPSDHTSFAVRGVPALLFFTGIHGDYHTPDDDAAKVAADGIARVAQLVQRVAGSLADAPVRPPSRKVGAAPAPSQGRGYGAYLGTIPAFGGPPVSGVRLSGVRQGSPADAAGLRADDVIVSFGDSEVANLEEFAALLFRARPGSEVEIGVLREGERLTMGAKLGQRR